MQCTAVCWLYGKKLNKQIANWSPLTMRGEERRCEKILLSLSLSSPSLLTKCDNSIGFYKSEMLLFIDVGTVGVKNKYKLTLRMFSFLLNHGPSWKFM